MASIEYSQVRKGMVIVGDGGQLFTVVDRDLNTPGNWRAQLKLKLKNLKTGSITENKVRPQDKCEQAYLDKREMQYIYQEGDGYVFMDKENYEQMTLDAEFLEGQSGYLLPNTDVQINFYNGRPIGVELPPSVVLTVIDTEPGIKHSTATTSFKPAKLETGITVQVPPFVTTGEKIKVDTAEGTYMERA